MVFIILLVLIKIKSLWIESGKSWLAWCCKKNRLDMPEIIHFTYFRSIL